jgi:hypothetical protein
MVEAYVIFSYFYIHIHTYTHVTAVPDANLKSSPCTTHALQRTIINSLNAVPEIKTMLKTMKSAVAAIRMSHSQKAYLREAQQATGTFDHQLVQSNTTRWSSVANSIERLLEQRPAIEAAYGADDRARPTRRTRDLVFPQTKRIDPDTFSGLTDLLAVLDPFRMFTTVLQGEFGTAGKVVPAIFKLKTLLAAEKVTIVTPASGPSLPGNRSEVFATALHPAVQKVRHHMFQDIATRFHWDTLRDTFAIASLLDPRFKTLSDYHVPDHYVDDAWRLLRMELDTTITTLKDADMYTNRGEKRDAGRNVVVDTSDPFAAENTASRSSAVSAGVFLGNHGHGDGRFVMGADADAENLANLNEVNQDLADYIRMPIESSTSCPLEWWRRNKQFFPALAKLARQYLCVSATSAGVERFFSAAGLTINHLRTRLSSQSVEKILYLRLNWDNSLYTVDLRGADLEEAKGLEGGDGAIDDGPDDDEGDQVDEEEEDAALYPMGFEGEDFAFLDDEPGFLEGDSL